MRLRLHRIPLAAGRFSSLLKFSCIGKMTGRGMKSTAGGSSWDSSNNLTENEPQLWDSTSQAACEKEFPSISAAVSSMAKCKRRTRVDLGTHREKKLDNKTQNIVPLIIDESTSKFSPDTTMDEPFDICHSETPEYDPDELWVPEVEPTVEHEKHKDNIEDSIEEIGQVLRPGMVLFKNYLSLSEQVEIVNTCQELGCGPGGFYRPGYDNGAKLRLYMMCLGLDWNPQTKTYARKRHHDNATPPQIPPDFIALVSRVLNDSHAVIKRNSNSVDPEDILPAMSPDVCIVNFYKTNGHLGLNQDCDESPDSLMNGLPVVSISIGDSAEFLYGRRRDVKKAEQILLESGDVLIFGGESRHIFHGVKHITPNTAPSALLESTKLRPGRLNLTFRKS